MEGLTLPYESGRGAQDEDVVDDFSGLLDPLESEEALVELVVLVVLVEDDDDDEVLLPREPPLLDGEEYKSAYQPPPFRMKLPAEICRRAVFS